MKQCNQLLYLLSLITLFHCGFFEPSFVDNQSPSTKKSDTPQPATSTTCADADKSFATLIQPTIQSDCSACHATTGTNSLKSSALKVLDLSTANKNRALLIASKKASTADTLYNNITKGGQHVGGARPNLTKTNIDSFFAVQSKCP